MKVLLVSPATPDTFWSFKYALRFISRKSAYPPLGLLTVAAMLPAEWKFRLVDLNVSRLTDADIDWADYVLISAMIVHADSCHRIVARCRAKSKTIIAGGPLFTTGHEQFPEIQHFVLGEAEHIMPALIEDMSSGNLKAIYQDPHKPDLTSTPVPRWDLIRFKDYAAMAVQLSRGCPFDCEFCDIIVMYGRVPRVKTPAQMVKELDALVDAGWKSEIFIVDDNFIGNKAKVKALLKELVAWRERRAVGVSFLTEASLNLADAPELLDLMVRAGFTKVFIGIESPDEDSLLECRKVQNTRRDLIASVRKIQNAGMEVMGGFIVGFDNDKRSIFEQQRRFIQEAGVVTAMVGLLTALPETRLFSRLKKEGRILHQSTGNNLDAVLNFIPKLDREVLIEGYRSLLQHLYTPKVYYRRALTFLSEYRPQGSQVRPRWNEIVAFGKSLWVMGFWARGRREYWKYVTKALLFHRRSFTQAMGLAITGHHFRKVVANL
ncbi:MAG: B12-binding domain-containing radical SAM protein [Phycisphaerae bacterium]